MPNQLVFLTIPGLRRRDLPQLTALQQISGNPSVSQLSHSFPAVTWPAQANMLCGCGPEEHGVVANGYYWRDEQKIEMWTAWNNVIQRPQIWDLLKQHRPDLKTAAWFPMLSKGCNADYVCMPAPIHKPDGSEDLWCHTKPQEFYGELLNSIGHFPLKHFWGPLAGIQSSQWIVDSAIAANKKFSPNFWYIYLPHLDYAAQKHGPDSPQATAAVDQLNDVISALVAGIHQQSGSQDISWMIASEYVISPVDHVSYPNRFLRQAGLLKVKKQDDGEHLDLDASRSWALVDHQFSHVFVKNRDPETISAVAELFSNAQGIERVLAGDDRAQLGMNHERSGDVILLSHSNSWQAYYWWLDDAHAPAFARTVDIHRKPGYDPVELFFDMQTRSVPLDATLIRGSHGVIHPSAESESVLWCNNLQSKMPESIVDTDICQMVLSQFANKSS